MPRLDRRLAPALRLPLALLATSTALACASGGTSTSSAAPTSGTRSTASASLPKESANASLCDTPPLDTTAFHRVERGGYSVGVPRGFGLFPGSDVDFTEFRSGARRVVLVQGNYPTLFRDGEVPTLLRSSCTANINGWPVEVVLISYDVKTEALTAPDQTTGMHFVVGARWSHALGGRDVAMWVDTKDPAVSRRLRAMFWTVRFKGDSATGGGH